MSLSVASRPPPVPLLAPAPLPTGTGRACADAGPGSPDTSSSGASAAAAAAAAEGVVASDASATLGTGGSALSPLAGGIGRSEGSGAFLPRRVSTPRRSKWKFLGTAETCCSHAHEGGRESRKLDRAKDLGMELEQRLTSVTPGRSRDAMSKRLLLTARSYAVLPLCANGSEERERERVRDGCSRVGGQKPHGMWSPRTQSITEASAPASSSVCAHS
jgi:hypothetical protein